MSRLTAEGRKRARDHQLEDINRRLREDKNLRGLSRYQRGTLAATSCRGRKIAQALDGFGSIVKTRNIAARSSG